VSVSVASGTLWLSPTPAGQAQAAWCGGMELRPRWRNPWPGGATHRAGGATPWV